MVDLAKRERIYQNLKPGDRWTFTSLKQDQMIAIREIGVGGVFARWFNTGEPGREFRIVAIHEGAVETEFVGFQTFLVTS
jgi:hypothetical protein